MVEEFGELLLYRTEDGESRIEVRLEDGTVWLTQTAMSRLYQTTRQSITIHISNIFRELELDPIRVFRQLMTTAADGKSYRTKYYNLDVILAVGYRVRSQRGTQFRQWATERLREYLIKGFAMDDERLKQGRSLGIDYFDELLERIRDIRGSEKRFYQQIRDVYKLAIDYDPNAEATREFFQIVQNKLHWAVSGKTAAEIIQSRADANHPNMGLTSWKGAKVRRDDVTVAKNYLNADEIEELNRIIVMYLDYAEDQARRQRPIYMKEWRERLDAFLRFNEREILENAGKVSMEVAKALAHAQYDEFSRRRLNSEAEREDEIDSDELKRIADRIEQKEQR